MISEIALMKKPRTSMSAIDRDFLCILSLFCVMGICTAASSFLIMFYLSTLVLRGAVRLSGG